ncbi:MAG: DNA cytosine methyltransferase [Chloroflexota bacterium]
MYAPTVIDLFSGCGGMSWGLHKAGFKTLAGVDNTQHALNTFKYNHNEAAVIKADMTTLNPEHVMEILGLLSGQLDCLVGGPPCQGFSKNVPATYRFLDDPRNLLFVEYIRFVNALKPKVVVMENVAEIYNAYSGRVRTEIESSLEKLGYRVTTKVLYAPDYGVPQRRRRCVFFASRTGIDPVFPEPSFADQESITLFGEIKKYRSAWLAISDLPVIQDGEGYEPMPYDKEPENEFQVEMRKKSRFLYDHIAKKLRPTQFARISSIKAGQGLKDLPSELRPKSGYSGAYGRLDFEMLAPTITRWVFHPGSGRYGHPREARLLTIREAARLQTFSDDFRFAGTYVEKASQIGNAVPPMLMHALSPKILELLGLQSESPSLSLRAVVSAQS